MPFEPYTFYILSAYGVAFLGLFGLLGSAYFAQRKVMREYS